MDIDPRKARLREVRVRLQIDAQLIQRRFRKTPLREHADKFHIFLGKGIGPGKEAGVVIVLSVSGIDREADRVFPVHSKRFAEAEFGG